MRKSILSAACLFAILCLAFLANAATLNVDNTVACSDTTGTPYCTIQAAIDDVSSGDTVNVVAGTYNEEIGITKGLTLTTPDIGGATIDGGIWIKNMHTFTDPITVEYFTIQNGAVIDANHDYCIKISGDVGLADMTVADMHIVHNTFINCGKTDDVTDEMWWNAAVFYDVNHFGALGSRYDSIFTTDGIFVPGTGEISYNTIINNLADPSQRTQLGIGVRSGRNMKINHNDISGNVAEGIHHWGPVNTASTGNYEIDYNNIDLSGWVGDPIGNNPRGIWSYAPQSSISYNTIISKWIGMVLTYWDDTFWGGATAGTNLNLVVDNNLIHPPAGESMSVGMRISGNNNDVTDNEIYGATNNDPGRGAGIIFEGWGFPEWGERTESSNNIFTGNYIHDNYNGIFTWDAPYDNTFNNVFHLNRIEDNTNFGFYNGHAGEIVNAEHNWWGDASGPTHAGNPGGTGDSVTDDVDYDPWLTGEPENSQTDTVTGTDPSVSNPGAGIDVDVTGATYSDTTGTIGTSGYTGEPAADNFAVGTGDTAMKFFDVFASGFTGGMATITVSYTDAELFASGIDENSLNLYMWYDGAWNLGANPGRDTANNKVWGTFDITKLTGSPGGLGGNPIPPGAFYTKANVPAGVGDAPVVKAKWEIVFGAADLDDDPSKDWTQANAPGTYQGKRTIGYWMVVTDPNGFGDLTNKAYADVFHPDGSFKYQVELTETYNQCPEDDTAIDAAIAAITAADAAGLVTYNTGYDLTDVIAELEQCSAKAFYGTAELDYHQMCGEFSWHPDPTCGGCEWIVNDFSKGYKVVGYAFDKYNVKSTDLVNYFEYICSAGIELDFDSLNFGSVVVSSNKWIEGNTVFDSGDGPACAPGPADCRAPTVRNIGNIPVFINVNFTDMQFGYSGPSTNKNWNVQWDARLGLGTPKYFDPYVKQKLPETLGLCNTEKISFSIHVKKATQTGGHTGSVLIEPEAVSFPWWP